MLKGEEGQGLEKAILYARVSTAGQARRGYSLAQQLEALRAHAACAGYRVLAEVPDEGQSGATLNRPGLARVRDLVAASGVAAVLVQDLDRLVREPEHHLLLRAEFRKHGCEIVVLDDHGALGARIADREVERIAERSTRGKLRKAREGKILAGTSANYGFRFNAARDGYEVDPATMEVVGCIFRMLGVEKRTLHAIKGTLEAENVPAPAGGGRWSTWVIRRFVLDDLYKPHSFREIEALVSREVAAGLDRDRRYGIWWFNRERWTTRQVPEISGGERRYRRRVSAVPRPREEWVAVPVPDSGLAREVVDAAREVVLNNKQNTRGTERFWELSGGILRCASCGSFMRTCVTRRNPDRVYFYYTCARHHKEREACPNRRSYRADILEPTVLRAVCELLAEPDRVHEGFESWIRRERSGARGEPGEEGSWLERLAEIEHARGRYQAMTARGLLTFDELGARLDELEASRRITLGQLRAVRGRQEEVERLERERDEVLEVCADAPAGALAALQPEERHRIYSKLGLVVLVGQEGGLRVSGIPGTVTLGLDEP
jgi:site-specific DNA recombinase